MTVVIIGGMEGIRIGIGIGIVRGQGAVISNQCFLGVVGVVCGGIGFSGGVFSFQWSVTHDLLSVLSVLCGRIGFSEGAFSVQFSGVKRRGWVLSIKLATKMDAEFGWFWK